MRPLLFALLAAFSTSTAVGQAATLQIDSSVDNSCMKSQQGGMWVLRLSALPITLSQTKAVMVDLERIESTTQPPRTVSYMLLSGQSIPLGCTQGDPVVSYRIVKQR